MAPTTRKENGNAPKVDSEVDLFEKPFAMYKGLR